MTHPNPGQAPLLLLLQQALARQGWPKQGKRTEDQRPKTENRRTRMSINKYVDEGNNNIDVKGPKTFIMTHDYHLLEKFSGRRS